MIYCSTCKGRFATTWLAPNHCKCMLDDTGKMVADWHIEEECK